jgi:ribonuclease HI
MNIPKITIFTDGSSRGNPGPGGFAAIVVSERGVLELGGRENRTTNNRMELRAAIEGLSHLAGIENAKESQVTIYCDSQYVINGITKWVFGWEKNEWQTVLKKRVENQDLWKELLTLSRVYEIDWKYVGGHVGVPANERCDEIATAFADGIKIELYQGAKEKYPVSLSMDESVEKRELRDASRTRRAGKAFSYLSMVNGTIEKHATWAECEKRVRGAKGARYKKALSKEEEQSIIRDWTV